MSKNSEWQVVNAPKSKSQVKPRGFKVANMCGNYSARGFCGYMTTTKAKNTGK